MGQEANGALPYPVAVVDDLGPEAVYAAQTGGLLLPSGVTSQRPATPANGTIRYNSQTNVAEAYLNGAWITLLAGTLDKAAVGLGNVDNTADADKPISSATQTALDAKKILRRTYFQTNTETATSNAPIFTGGDVAPTISQGTEVMTVNHTPLAATNILDIEVEVNLAHSDGFAGGIFALFKAGVTDALSTRQWYATVASVYPYALRHSIVAGDTNQQTFSVRAAPSSSGKTMGFNRTSGGQLFANTIFSSIIITERLP